MIGQRPNTTEPMVFVSEPKDDHEVFLDLSSATAVYESTGDRLRCVVLGAGDAAREMVQALGAHAIHLELGEWLPTVESLERARALEPDLIFRVCERN